MSRRSEQIYYVTNIVDGGYIQANVTGTDVPGNVPITFNSLDQYLNYTNVFDQYRIVQVSVEFQSIQNLYAGGPGFPGFLYTVLDYDDDSNITAAQAREYNSVMETRATSSITRTLVPHIAVVAFAGSLNGTANVVAPWIDTASPSVQHYGVKYVLSGSTYTVATNIYRIFVRYCLAFRQVR
jgi:hypothetical protein